MAKYLLGPVAGTTILTAATISSLDFNDTKEEGFLDEHEKEEEKTILNQHNTLLTDFNNRGSENREEGAQHQQRHCCPPR